MKCHYARKHFVDLFDSYPDPELQHDLDIHFETCPECARLYEEAKQTFASVKPTHTIQASNSFKERVMNQIIHLNATENLKEKRKENSIMKVIRNRVTKPNRLVYTSGFVVLVFALLIGGNWMNQGNNLVFAEVLERIRAVRTICFTNTVEMEDQTFVTRTECLESGRQRTILPDGNIIIMDMAQGKSLTLIPLLKTASIAEMINQPNQPNQPNQKPGNNFIEAIRNLEEGAEEVLGWKEIDGIHSYGFRVRLPGMDYTIWADSMTRLPVRIEVTFALQGSMKVILTDFEFDLDLDESLFSLEPPADYDLIQIDPVDVSLPTEQDLIATLKMVIDPNDQTFPETLDMADLSKRLGAKMKFENTPEGIKEFASQFANQFAKLTRGRLFAQLNADNDWHYEPADKKLGDTLPLCWWKPEGSETYRVIYADLSVADVHPDEFTEE